MDNDDEDVYAGESAYHTQLEENTELTNALYEPNSSYENDKVQVLTCTGRSSTTQSPVNN